MNDLAINEKQIPDTIEDLSRFVLINEERIQALRANIRAIKKVNLAKEVYEQKLAEAQEIGQITVEAAQKMGELLLQIQKTQGRRNDLETSPTGVEKSKTEITSEMGMTSQQVSQYQQMALNPEAVKAAIQKAIDNGDVVSRSQVMKEIKAVKDELAERDRKIAELSQQEPIIEEIIKEVVPSDYEEIKGKLDEYKKDYRNMENLYKEMADKWKASENEIDRIKKAQEEKENNPQEQIRMSSIVFCAGVSNFIEKYGGYVWLTEHINEMPEVERKGFISGINALDAWVQQMKTNIGGNLQ